MTDFEDGLRQQLEQDAQRPVTPFAAVLAAARRKRTRRRAGITVGAAAAVALVVATPLLVGDPAPQAIDPAPSPSLSTTSTSAEPTDAPTIDLPEERPPEDYPMGDPPRFRVLTADGQVNLRPWTMCTHGYCYDGAPDDKNLVDVGDVDHIDFGFDMSEWEFRSVTFRKLDTNCPRTISVEATKTGERTFRIDPAGPAGRWAVDIFGRGPVGDAVTTVEWTTSEPGTLGPPARGAAAVLADLDPGLTSYGVELSLRHLDAWYPDASATIEVSSATGGSVTIPLTHDGRCGYQGDMFFTASTEQGLAATQIGEGPFRYVARLDLGDTTHVGTGTWPDDLIRGYHPNIRLRWSPALPGYADHAE